MGLEHKVRLVTYNTSRDFLVKQSGLYVLVGVPSDLDRKLPDYEERNGLAEWLKDNGLNVKKVDCYWPRDRYVWFKDTYVYNYDYFDEGGCFVFGQNYLLASADMGDEEDVEKARQALESMFGAKAYMVKSYRDREGPRLHLDLTVSIIESRKLLLVDYRHYRQQKRMFEKIAYEQGQKLVVVNSRDEARLWPMNMLVLDDRKKATVVANSECKKLMKVLNKYDLELITSDFLNVPEDNGSIRCVTNTVEGVDVFREIRECLYNENKRAVRKKE